MAPGVLLVDVPMHVQSLSAAACVCRHNTSISVTIGTQQQLKGCAYSPQPGWLAVNAGNDRMK